MSRIYEAIKIMEAERLEHGAPEKDALGVMEMPERRQTWRRELHLQITVYGRAPGGSPFYREANAVSGNGDGGLIAMRAPVFEGQELLLINNHSAKEQLCRVVNVRARDGETNEVGVAFSSPDPEFWLITDPPLPEVLEDEGF